MIRADLNLRLQQAIDALVRDGRLPAGLSAAEVADPRDPSHGDFATNFALVASKPAGKNPRELAEMVRAAVSDAAVFESIEVAGPGFINFRLTPGYIAGWLPALLAEGEHLAHAAGKSNPNPQRINVEFVSVNPNGPITIGSGRGAAFGSTLCSVLEAAGNTVHREYYINDGVNSEQMRQFAVSVVLSMLDIFRADTSMHEKPYKGDYVLNSTKDILGARLVPRLVNKLMRERGWTRSQYRKYREAIRVISLEPGSAPIGHLSPIELLNLSVWCIPEEDAADRNKFNKLFDYLFVMLEFFHHLNLKLDMPEYWNWLERHCPDQDLYQVYERFLSEAIVWHMQRIAGAPEPPAEAVTPEALESYFRNRHTAESVNAALSWIVSNLDPTSEIFEELTAGDYVEGEHLSPALIDAVREQAEGAMLARQIDDLRTFATTFDTWFSEQSLHDSGAVQHDISALVRKSVADTRPIRHKLKLGKGGVLEDVEIEAQAGATEDEGELTPPPSPLPASGEGENATLWLRSTKFGDDQDRVLRRQDGRLTYIASDVAYHKDKFNRPANADKLITVLGPDHHGYIGRLHAVVAALEVEPTENPDAAPLTELEAKLYASPADRDACQAALARSKEKLEVVIFQLVRFMKEGKPAPMRKRDGNIYAIIDLVDEIGRTVKPNASKAEQQEVGKDVARFFYLMRSHDTTFDFDLDLAERQSDENPVFYVQYAHARICSVIAKAAEAGLTAESNPGLIDHPKELALIKMIADLPYEVSRAAADYGVHRLTTYAIDLARAYHHFYDACRVIQPELPELSRARISLCVATRNALRSVFNLLGISAPERMDRSESLPT